MIESLNNLKIKNYTKLHDKKYRDETGLFIAFGSHLVEEAIKHNLVKDLFILSNTECKYNYNPIYVSNDVMRKLSGITNPPKEIAICNKISSSEIKGNIIILDDISDPGNLGTIIRSAVAFDYQTIILSPRTVDIYNPKVVRSTEGMLFNINIIIAEISDIIPKLKDMDYLIYGTNVNGGESPLPEIKKHALIIGSEASGMNKNLNKYCDKKIYIKMNSLCESLNAGVSASILMFELSRGNK